MSRELENLIKRLMAMESDDTITAASVTRELAATPATKQNGSQPWISTSRRNSLKTIWPNTLPHSAKTFRPAASTNACWLKLSRHFRASLTATNGNQLRAADLLGINRNTLRTKLRNRNVKSIRELH